MNNISYAIISGEIVSIIITLIILYGEVYETKNKSDIKSRFEAILVISVLATLSDTITYFFEGKKGYDGLLVFLGTLAIIMGYWLVTAYIVYIFSFLSTKGAKPKINFSKIFICIAVIMSLVFVIMMAGGKIYVVENGYFLSGDYFFIGQIYYILSFVVCFIVIFYYREILGKHDALVLVSFGFAPAVSIVINFAIPEYTFSYIATSFSLVLLYVMLQAENEKGLKERERILEVSSHIDSLTGLMNRLSYEEACNKLDPDIEVGVVFGDINGLKYTNDNFGHKAGDDLVASFAELLKKCFRQDDIFRISGDEFVVVLPSASVQSFDVRFKSLHSQLENSERPSAAVGAAHGRGADILNLVNKAEENMYFDKNKFYERYPYMKR